jgi:hypothetical protein
MRLFLHFTVLLLVSTTVFAQSGITVSGATATGTGGSATYSIGQLDYVNISNSNGIVTQGIQQPYEIYTVSGVEVSGIELYASVHPNPTQKSVMLTVSGLPLVHMYYVITDLQGQILVHQGIETSQTTVSLGDISAGSYYIKVYSNNEFLKTFKIIKI